MKERTFGEALRAARQRADRSMGEVARYLDLSVPFISDVEKGRRGPLSPKKILEVARYLGTDAQQLLNAAAIERGHIELSANDSHRLRIGVALARKWRDLSDAELEAIGDLLKK